MWKAFPSFLLKRGFTIRLQLSTQFALKPLDTTIGLAACKLIAGKKEAGGAGAAYNNLFLDQPIALIHHTIPDQTHLNLVKNELTSGSGVITFPFHCFFGSNDKTHKS